MFAVDHIILLSAVLAILGVLASKLSPRFGVPVLVLFLGVGMLAGEDGIGRIFFDNADAAHAILTKDSRTCSGSFFIDEHCLRDEGVTDFTKYAVNPDRELARDIFLDEEPTGVG